MSLTSRSPSFLDSPSRSCTTIGFFYVQQLQAVMVLPPNIEQHAIWDLTFGAGDAAIGDEMRNHHRTVILSRSDWCALLESFSHAPITSEFNKFNKPKPLLLAVEIPCGVAGQTKDGLILACQADSMDATMLAEMNNSSTGAAKYANHSVASESDICLGLAQTLRWLLLDPMPRLRPLFKIGSLELARGAIVELAEYPSGAHHGTPSSGTTLWVTISSSLWLGLLATASKHSAGIGGLLRDVAMFAPLIPGPPPTDELVITLPGGEPGLPNGGYCRFNLFRTRSLQRIASVCGLMTYDMLAEIDTALEEYLGISVEMTCSSSGVCQ